MTHVHVAMIGAGGGDVARALLHAILETADVISTPYGPVLAAPIDVGLLAQLEVFDADLADREPDAEAEQ